MSTVRTNARRLRIKSTPLAANVQRMQSLVQSRKTGEARGPNHFYRRQRRKRRSGRPVALCSLCCLLLNARRRSLRAE
jgi:hypothetical protein